MTRAQRPRCGVYSCSPYTASEGFYVTFFSSTIKGGFRKKVELILKILPCTKAKQWRKPDPRSCLFEFSWSVAKKHAPALLKGFENCDYKSCSCTQLCLKQPLGCVLPHPFLSVSAQSLLMHAPCVFSTQRTRNEFLLRCTFSTLHQANDAKLASYLRRKYGSCRHILNSFTVSDCCELHAS